MHHDLPNLNRTAAGSARPTATRAQTSRAQTARRSSPDHSPTPRRVAINEPHTRSAVGRPARSSPGTDERHSRGLDRRPLFIVAGVACVLCLVLAVASRGDAPATASAAPAALAPAALAQSVDAGASAAVPAQGPPGAVAPAGTEAVASAGSVVAGSVAGTALPDLDGSDLTTADSCLMDELSIRMGATGTSVQCLQQALLDGGFYTGAVTGTFDQATFGAVEKMQSERNLFVDGIVGRESAISLGIWPDEASFVVRTPKPASGAVDLMGYPLSSVASAGSDAPPLPPDSGSGRRLVYDRAGQRVWAVDGDGQIIRSWLISGSKYSNELPGTHEVYSRSDVSTAWNGKAYLPKMVRWLKTDIGAIGFHSIPLHVEDNSPYQTEAELGTRLSGGCQRQAVRDADFLWDFADVGTKVVVV